MSPRNKALVKQYEDDVLARYADSFVADVIVGGALKRAVNEIVLAAATAAWEAACALIDDENRRTIALHRQEVADKMSKEEMHKQVDARGVILITVLYLFVCIGII